MLCRVGFFLCCVAFCFINQTSCFSLFRPKSRTLGGRTGLLSPKELLERQINDLYGRIDTLNSELAQTMSTESDLIVTLDKMKSDEEVSDERLEEIQQQLTSAEMQKENLLKKLDHLEEEVRKKRKETNEQK